MTLARRALQYMGVRPKNPPNVQLALINPTTQDDFVKGDLWLNTVLDTCFMWSGDTWIAMGSGATGGVVTLTADSGGPLSPTAGNIDILGTADQITTTGAASTITISLPAAIIAPGSLETTTTLEAGTTIVAGTTITATLGAITATNGNLVLGTAGNKIVSTSVGAAAAAGANSFGKVTLVNGTITVATTAVTAASIIMLTRHSVGASGTDPIGLISVGTVVAATSFVINALDPADASQLIATDLSVVSWMIIN